MRDDVIQAFRGIEHAAAGALAARFSFAPDASLFQGHFPGMPILPAVLQIEMARYVVDAATDARHRLVEVQRAKFNSEIKPAEEITVEVKLEATDQLRAVATLKVGQEIKSSMTLILARIM